MDEIYEYHKYEDPQIPFIVHQDSVGGGNPASIYLHWHENPEILYILEGAPVVCIDGEKIPVEEGDIVVINANCIHSVVGQKGFARYHCLIIDKSFCEEHGFLVEETLLKRQIRDAQASAFYLSIINEIGAHKEYYRAAVRVGVLNLLLHLFRGFTEEKTDITARSTKTEMVKKGMRYMRSHYKRELKIDEVAEYCGFSKYYFCRTFKEVTGGTVLAYVSGLRISLAYRMLKTGDNNISEIANACGFGNLSYFTKTFKKHMGLLPSKITPDYNK